MPRKPRFFLPDVPSHIVQRGHNRDPVFFDIPDYQAYLLWLQEASDRYGCSIHAYVLMTNHIHILATPADKNSISQMMQYLGRQYVPYINHTYERSGTIWEGRYKASLIDEDNYLLTCMRYIELNPVRANMVDTPDEYPWSSYPVNAEGEDSLIIKPHSLYKGLGTDEQQRKSSYKALFKAHIEQSSLKKIRAAWQTGTPLGNDNFRGKIEARLGCKLGQDQRGRPKKALTP